MASPDDQDKTRPGTPRPQPDPQPDPPAPATPGQGDPVDPDATRIPPPKQPPAPEPDDQEATRISRPAPTPPPDEVTSEDATRINHPAAPPPPATPPPTPPPTTPASPPPTGPPGAPPTMQLPAQGGGTPPVPPGWSHPPGAAATPPPKGPRQSRTPLLIAGLVLLAVVVLLVGGGAFAFFTGRLGFGPLSAQDKAAATAIGKQAPRPDWASADDVRCAAEGLVKDKRAGGLKESGLITPSGDGWRYAGRWTPETATSYGSSLLGCSDDWRKAVGQAWGMTDAHCLDEVDDDDMAGLVANTEMKVGGGSVTGAAAGARRALDDCAGGDMAKPTATATPAVLGVQFTVKAPDDGNTKMRVTDDTGEAVPGAGDGTYNLSVREGGTKGCITMEATVTHPWGSTQKSTGQACGTAKPRRLWWEKKASCNEKSVPCDTWVLHYEGFKLFEPVTIKLALNGGNCQSESGRCSQTGMATAKTGTWTEWTAPKNWHDKFTATVDGVVARIPN